MYYLNNKINNEEKTVEYAKKNNISLVNSIRTDSDDFLKKEVLPQNIKHIIIPTLSTLGNTSFKILSFIKQAIDEGRSIHVVDDSIVLDATSQESMNLIYALLAVEKKYIKERTELSKETRTKNKSKLGRKKGKRVKSKFDEHKEKIRYFYNKGYTIKKISDKIGIGTPQALGRYIKRNGFEINKEKKNLKDIIGVI